MKTTIDRVAVIFDNVGRPETTGVYCRRALGQLIEVEHFLPTELASIPHGRFDLFLRVDDGLDYRLPGDLRPAALWAIDTHLDFERTLRIAPDFEYVFAAQRDGAGRLRELGITAATWLPLACDPEIHARQEVEKQFDVCFVGNNFPGPRAELLELLQKEFPSHFVGRCYFEEMAHKYSASRIVFNRSLRNDVNMRVFEALASGSLLLTNALTENGLAELFQDGVHLATYQNGEELVDKVRFYLRNVEERERIAQAGREEVFAHHTYLHRMRTIMEAVVGKIGRSLQATSRGNDMARPSKEKQYFSLDRPEVVALIPRTARRVVDIGCGAGGLGAAVKQRQPAEVVGIELVAAAAEEARQRLDQVVMSNVESEEVDFPAGRFDCVVCADVLEHLRQPQLVLKKILRWLTADGCLVSSLPNVQHHSVVQSLLQGNWTYEPAGLLDDDHVRFFTRREIEKVLFRSGFEVSEIKVVPGPGYEEWHTAGRPSAVAAGNLKIQTASPAEAEEFYVYQYLVRARPAAIPDRGLTSIILVTYNELGYTRLCLESLRHRTDEPYELIVVDNGSTDGSVEYLRNCDDVQLIVNPENRGFPAAANQGIKAARGANILLLNNDTVVTTRWLRRLLDALHGDATTGLAGPRTNRISGEQQIPTNYTDLASLDGFAWEHGKKFDRQRIDTDRLVGFCLLMRRTVIDRIGLLDERFGIGNFEDDDFCRRALAAGFRAVIAADSYIHHFGSRTFMASGIDFGGLLEENRRKFEEKWSATVPPGPSPLVPNQSSGNDASSRDQAPVPLPLVPGSTAQRLARPKFIVTAPPGTGLCLRANSIKSSVCIIVRNNETTIGPCVESIRPWVGEIIVVDTGSHDKTQEICRRYGARLFEFPWCDDFSAARNESLKHARGEWIFWMDSDDTIPAECGRRLRELANGPHDPNTLGYIMQVHCPGADRERRHEITVVDHIKLIRNRPDVFFEGRIHEQLLQSIQRANGDVVWTDLYVVHSGSDNSPEGRQRKIDRDLRILHRELVERPNHPFVLFNLGMTYADAKRYEEAIDYLQRCLAASKPPESHLRKAYALLIISLEQVARHDEAWRFCERGLSLFPDDKELLFRCAMLHHHFGRLRDAEQTYLRVLNGREERHLTSVVRGLSGHMARHNLALVYDDMGRLDEAERQWRSITEELPEHGTGWRGLGDVLLRSGKHAESEQLALRLLKKGGNLRNEGLLLRGRLAAARGEVAAAVRDFEEADRNDRHDPEALRSLCRILFEKDDLEAAAQKLGELTVRAPDDASAFHNLGTVQSRRKAYARSAEAFARSVELRPDAPDSWLQWCQSLKQAGRAEEALAASHQFLKQFPEHPSALTVRQWQESPEFTAAPSS